MSKYLTKSRYKIGRDCPTKLYYHNNKDKYADASLDDSFLLALAKGGFQVGELAKIYNPNGIDVKALGHDESLELTIAELKKDNCTIYEAAFNHDLLFIRVDVFRKRGNSVDLIEVKAKSIDPAEENPFWNKRELKKGKFKITEKWKPYIYDVAFQTYVMQQIHSDWKITPKLMLANKAATANIDGLNQMFKLAEKDGRSEAYTDGNVTLETVGDKILIEIDVSEVVNLILEDKVILEDGEKTFGEEIEYLTSILRDNRSVKSSVSLKCKSCQFKCDKTTSSLNSGFHECWADISRKENEINGPFVFDIWNFRKASKLLESGVFLAREIQEDDVKPTHKEGSIGFSSSERQWEQVQGIKSRRQEPSVKMSDLRREIQSWQFPLHFIDFETTMMALPFNKGRAPYEQIAFQFSHHIVWEDGRIEHAGEYINREKGKFPNYDFVRQLKAQLENDSGSIFRYAAHENTVLCQIYDQLQLSDEPDKDVLCEWIKTLTKARSSSQEKWEGDRNMIDMCDIAKKFYYHPFTGGSNSIKKVLPAILRDSKALQQKYSEAIYGTQQIKSLNFSGWNWIEFDSNGEAKDPYKLLPTIFDGIDTKKLDLLMGNDELSDGGAAMTAYAKMQFSEMSEKESELVTSALLKYCELDTFAMVLLYEYWVDLVGEKVIQEVA